MATWPEIAATAKLLGGKEINDTTYSIDLPIYNSSRRQKVLISKELMEPDAEFVRISSAVSTSYELSIPTILRDFGRMLVGAISYLPPSDGGPGIAMLGTSIPLDLMDLSDTASLPSYLSTLAGAADKVAIQLATGYHIDKVRATVLDILANARIPASVNEYGSIFVPFEDNPVVCRLPEVGEDPIVLRVSSPILLDLSPSPELYELISISQVSLPFGAIMVGAGGEPGLVMLELSAQLYADALTDQHLVRTVRMIHAGALEQINLLRRLSPPLGGHRAYEGQ
jgi:hypothetical protein